MTEQLQTTTMNLTRSLLINIGLSLLLLLLLKFLIHLGNFFVYLFRFIIDYCYHFILLS